MAGEELVISEEADVVIGSDTESVVSISVLYVVGDSVYEEARSVVVDIGTLVVASADSVIDISDPVEVNVAKSITELLVDTGSVANDEESVS